MKKKADVHTVIVKGKDGSEAVFHVQDGVEYSELLNAIINGLGSIAQEVSQ